MGKETRVSIELNERDLTDLLTRRPVKKGEIEIKIDPTFFLGQSGQTLEVRKRIDYLLEGERIV